MSDPELDAMIDRLIALPSGKRLEVVVGLLEAVTAERDRLRAVVAEACAELDRIAEQSGWGNIGVVVERLMEAAGVDVRRRAWRWSVTSWPYKNWHEFVLNAVVPWGRDELTPEEDDAFLENCRAHIEAVLWAVWFAAISEPLAGANDARHGPPDWHPDEGATR